MQQSDYHQTVMLNECITGLNIKNNGIYIDATLGRGGHTIGIINKLGEKGRVIAFDQDICAIEYAKKNLDDKRLQIIHSSFTNMKKIVLEQNLIKKIDGVLMDLGVSSPQLDNIERGFSFNKNGPLDMRMDQTKGITAMDWLDKANEKEIADIIYKFGEEKRSRAIAKAIKKYQINKKIETTMQLADIVSSVVKSYSKKHPATRTFQAIRIFINQELTKLSLTLEQIIDLIAPKGRLCITSFHSMEDRIVKQFIKKNSQAKKLPKRLPIIENNNEKILLKNLGRYFPSEEEVKNNKRARSAVLRVAEIC